MSVNDEDFVSLFKEDTGEVREDIKLPDQTEDDEVLCKRIRDGLESGKNVYATVLASMEIEKITDVQEKNN
jgi:hypothetical protein